MKSKVVLQIITFLLTTSSFGHTSENELARDSEPLMVMVTLSGSMIAVDPQTSHLRWMQQFDPVLRTSQGTSNLNSSSIFLPDPVSGSLYSMKQNPHEVDSDDDDWGYELEKMQHSIPDLALKAPFRSPEENILYTGRKSDSWFIINSKTGECKNVFDFNHNEESTDLMPMTKINDVYIGRTQYDVCMANMNPTSRNKEVWNVSMYQYNAFEMGEDIIDKYEFVHIVSSSSGKILTLTKQSGDVVWTKSDLNSPVVALFLMGKNGFLNIPFTSVDDRVFEMLAEPAKVDRLNVHLRETVYIGKNKSSASTIFYAIPSYIDDQNHIITKQAIGNIDDPAMIPGHYLLSAKDIKLIADDGLNKKKEQEVRNESAAVQETKDEKIDSQMNYSVAYGVIFASSIAIVIIVFFKLNDKNSRFKRVINQESQNSTRSNLSDREDFPPTIGKISFDPHDLLGKGSEGTSVYRGYFDNRTVAVKRLLVDCFGIADKEVRMLRESDNHENIIRYFCTEFDREFCYIAVELCICTLHDYAVNVDFAYLRDLIKPKEMLYQATRGLSHLHQLNIIHRDIKPQNILLSMPDSRNNVRALISDFGLCKKVDKDASLSMRTNAAGTEGWIAPETLRNEKLSKSVDVFSLGCVFYYTMTNGRHPFGEILHRQSNILSNSFTLDYSLESAFDCEYEKIFAHELIAEMIKQQQRPTCDAVLKHPLFWSDSKMLDFMQVISDRVERLDTSDDPLWSLERNAKFVVRDDWKELLEEEIVNDLGKQRTYHGISVRDLMRAIRNKRNHYNELSEDVKRLLGAIPVDYCKFWVTRFPRLPSHAYHVMQMCSRESTFGRFYVRYFTFTKPAYLFDKTLDNHDLVELQKRVKIEIAAANSKKWFEQKQNQQNGWSYVNNNSKNKRGFYNFKMKNGGGNGGNIERRGSGGSAKDCDE